MNNKDLPVEKIYIAKIIGLDVGSAKFALLHTYQFNSDSGTFLRSNYSLSKDALEGYLEGATATPIPYIREIINGIPDSERRGYFPKLKIDKLSYTDFASLIEGAGLELRVKLSPLG